MKSALKTALWWPPVLYKYYRYIYHYYQAPVVKKGRHK